MAEDTTEQTIDVDDYIDDTEDLPVGEYDMTPVPSDFTILTLKDLMDRGSVRIPGFQRNFVWDRKRASKLIESLIVGLPVPQIFLYAKDARTNLVIDGQQRLMSLYYFMEGRFPRRNRRVELRRILDEHGKIPDDVLANGSYFENFKLQLPKTLPDRNNRLSGSTYENLSPDDKYHLDTRPVRCITVRQNRPQDDNSSMYEIFNRLNTGGINLRPQEIRASMYHSPFYDMLARINMEPGWRRLLQSPNPDLHMKDVEVLLRGFAMLVDHGGYAPSMTRFLDVFSRQCEKNKNEDNRYFKNLFRSFVKAVSRAPEDVLMNNGRFNVALYEAVFYAACKDAYASKGFVKRRLSGRKIDKLREDNDFKTASQRATTTTANVQKRLARALDILGAA